jgi:hypothetical protein
MGNEGLEPSRLAARDPKSRLSANSSNSPQFPIHAQVYHSQAKIKKGGIRCWFSKHRNLKSAKVVNGSI